MDPHVPPTSATTHSDWYTVLQDLRRSVSNLVLYVLECAPSSPPMPPAVQLPASQEALTKTTLDDAIASLVQQEPWMTPWTAKESEVLPPKKTQVRKKKCPPSTVDTSCSSLL